MTYLGLLDYDYGFLPDDFFENEVEVAYHDVVCYNCWKEASPTNPVFCDRTTGIDTCKECEDQV